jgi:acetoin:2,6-dichlorophenolindophenol oxidoreductase subunit beta
MSGRVERWLPTGQLMLADFAGTCFDQIVNQVAEYRYMTGGRVPLSERRSAS